MSYEAESTTATSSAQKMSSHLCGHLEKLSRAIGSGRGKGAFTWFLKDGACDESMQVRPYRFLRGFDLRATEQHGGGDVPLVWSESRRKELLATKTDTWKSYLPAQEREEKFLQAFQAMCCRLLPGLSDEQIDAKRMPDKSYMTIYRKLSVAKLLRKQVTRKRKRGEARAESEHVGVSRVRTGKGKRECTERRKMAWRGLGTT